MQFNVYRLEELNEKKNSMVQRVRVVGKEKSGLEVGYSIYYTKCFWDSKDYENVIIYLFIFKL